MAVVLVVVMAVVMAVVVVVVVVLLVLVLVVIFLKLQCNAPHYIRQYTIDCHYHFKGSQFFI